MGRFITGTIGLGIPQVSGRKRDPSPPAIIMAFNLHPSRKIISDLSSVPIITANTTGCR